MRIEQKGTLIWDLRPFYLFPKLKLVKGRSSKSYKDEKQKIRYTIDVRSRVKAEEEADNEVDDITSAPLSSH